MASTKSVEKGLTLAVLLALVSCSKNIIKEDPSGLETKPQDECAQFKSTPMVKLSSPKGVNYCIDRAEVTQAQYAEFLALKGGDMSGQDELCAVTNARYEPDLAYTEDGQPNLCPVSAWNPKEKGDFPVVCIGLCDARMYCQSVAKRLCGRIGGGVIKANHNDDPIKNDPEVSQLYNACSQGGKRAFALGARPDKGCASVGAIGDSLECHPAEAPYSEILGIGSGVGELEDIEIIPAKSLPAARAPKFGNGSADEFRCDNTGGAGYGEYVGFRCCADLPAP